MPREDFTATERKVTACARATARAYKRQLAPGESLPTSCDWQTVPTARDYDFLAKRLGVKALKESHSALFRSTFYNFLGT